jgi:uncharacterized protein (TIGR03086 family)
MNLVDLHHQAVGRFGDLVRAVGEDQWDDPTPCTDWDVRALVSHVVVENLWTAPLMEGLTIAEVGDRFDGDVLGTDPAGAWDTSARAAVTAVGATDALDRTVHLSFGDTPAEEYVYQLFSDHLIHSWDLARAIGADERLDTALVDACAKWFASMEDNYRSAGLIGERPQLPPGVDPQTELLAMFGRAS